MATIHTEKSLVYILYLLVFWIKLKVGNRKLTIKVEDGSDRLPLNICKDLTITCCAVTQKNAVLICFTVDT
jgi:hypothetical protein